MNRENVGTIIKCLRKSKGLSQKKLAELSGVSETTIILLESRKNGPTLYTAALLFDALGYELFLKKKEDPDEK